MHQEAGLPNPLDAFNVKQTLRGLKRQLGCDVKRKIAIEPKHLSHLFSKIQHNNTTHVVYFGAALVMFFTLLRRSNLLTTKSTFDPTKHLRRKDIVFNAEGATITIRWSKTNQFKSGDVVFPIPRLKDHHLCPVKWAMWATSIVPSSPNGPCFLIDTDTPLTPDKFVHLTKTFLSDIVSDPSDLGAHSFRRGGATFCYQHSNSIAITKALGLWKSDCYQDYVLPSAPILAQATKVIGDALSAMPIPP